MLSQKQKTQKKIGNIILGVALVAFVGIAAVISFTGFNTRKEVEEGIIAGAENSPKTWDTSESTSVVANSSLTGEVIESKYIQFTTSVTNSNSGDSLYITHLASYLTEDEKKGGFIPLAGNSLEYSYTPNAADSWTRIALNSPVADTDAFKLSTELHLGTLGTSTDTIYFRFYIEPERETKIVNNKISFLMRNSKGETGYTSSVATIAYKDAILTAQEKIAKADATGGENMDGAYTDPLGMFSFIPNVDVITSVVASTTGLNQNALTVGIITIGVGIIVFVICLVAYLPIIRKK